MIKNILQAKILLHIHSKTSLKAFDSIILELEKLELTQEQIELEANEILSLYENGIKNLNVKQFQNILILSKKRNTTKYEIESKLAFYEVKRIYRENILDFLFFYRKNRSLKLNVVKKNGVIESRRYKRGVVIIQFSTYENNIKHGIEHNYIYEYSDFSDCETRDEREDMEYYEWNKVQQKKYFQGKLISSLEFEKGDNSNFLNYFQEYKTNGRTYTKIEDNFDTYYGFNLVSKNDIINIEEEYLIESLPSDYDYDRLLLSEEYLNGKLNGYSRIFHSKADEFNYFGDMDLWDLENEIDKSSLLLEHQYKNDKLHGKQICFYGYEGLEYNKPISSQKMYELNFENGMLNGKQFFYFSNGEIKLELDFSNGNLLNNI
jgi:antitoxin component YwqK of YwqJK toxin-antitoxin module